MDDHLAAEMIRNGLQAEIVGEVADDKSKCRKLLMAISKDEGSCTGRPQVGYERVVWNASRLSTGLKIDASAIPDFSCRTCRWYGSWTNNETFWRIILGRTIMDWSWRRIRKVS
ncbi:hypothetical protein COOONC_12810 [Cooperia oncophora]